MTHRTVTAALVADLRPMFEGWNDPVAFGVGLDGALYAAARQSTERIQLEQGLGVFPKSQLDEPSDWLVLEWRDGRTRSFTLRDESIVISHIQPLGRNLLLAGCRCAWRAEGAERNACIVDWQGKEIARHTLGDGIQDVRVGRDDTIWVSYFDEGVFGNYGWGRPGPDPIGAPGLVGFTSAGEVRFTYSSGAAGTDDICDAYAVNVTRDGSVWLYFYTEFPIVRIRDGSYQVWELGQGGALALAARGTSVLLLGEYDQVSRLRWVELRDSGKAAVAGKGELALPDDAALVGGVARGVGDRIFMLSDRRVYVIDGW